MSVAAEQCLDFSASGRNNAVVDDLDRLSVSSGPVFALANLLSGIADRPWETAEAILSEFGTLGAALKGSCSRVSRVACLSTFEAFRRVDYVLGHVLYESVEGRVEIGDTKALIKYLTPTMQHLLNEQVRVLYFNGRCGLIKDEVHANGTPSTAYICVRTVISRCLEVGATAMILVHNHPSGDPSPSAQDIAVTRDVIDAGRALGIKVHDHLIIGTKGHVSLRSKGLM